MPNLDADQKAGLLAIAGTHDYLMHFRERYAVKVKEWLGIMQQDPDLAKPEIRDDTLVSALQGYLMAEDDALRSLIWDLWSARSAEIKDFFEIEKPKDFYKIIAKYFVDFAIYA